MFRFGILLMAVGVAGCAASGTRPAAGTEVAKNDPNRKVCRYYRDTGSIMPGKTVCHTEAEWQAIDQQNEQQAKATLGTSGRQNGTAGDLGN